MKFSQREVNITEDVDLKKKGYQEGTSERWEESQSTMISLMAQEKRFS